MKRCPYCFSELSNSAKKCKYCGEPIGGPKENIFKDNERKNNSNINSIIIGVVFLVIIIFGICYLKFNNNEGTKKINATSDSNIESNNNESDNDEIDWSFLEPSDKEKSLRQYDLDLCKNKDSYENYLKKKYNTIDLYEFIDKEEHFNKNDNKTYYYLDTYDMVHNNELDTCIAAYKLEYLIPEPNQYIDGYRTRKNTRYIVDSKNDKVLWERSTQGTEGPDTYFNEFWSEVDKYRDNLAERKELREKENEESTPYNFQILYKSDGTIYMPELDKITKYLFNKSYTDTFTETEKLIIQNKINEEAGFGHPRYIITDWNKKGGLKVIDAVENNIKTVDLSNIDLFTTEDFMYNDGNSEKNLTYVKDYGAPKSSGCYEYHNLKKQINCPIEMFPIPGSKMCFDLNKEEEINCNLINFQD